MKMKDFEKKLLSESYPVSRYWLLKKIEKGDLAANTLKQHSILNLIEGNIYKTWHKNCLQDMKRIKLHNCLAEEFAFISKPDVSLAKALSTIRRKYAKETNKTKQKQLGKMILMLQRLANSESMLYQQSKQHLDSPNIRAIIERSAKSIETHDELQAENLLFLKQSIKHYMRIVKLGVTPNTAELTICLNADFSNDEISERAFQLFCDAEKIIKATGMSSLPKTYAAKLARKKKLYNKPAAELTNSDIRILRIERMFA